MSPEYAGNAHSISVVTQIVPVACSVVGADGVAIQNLQQKDFRVFDDGADQPVVYFDASSQPASVAIMLDASPSVLRESDEMKNAARALVDALGSSDQTAVVDFSAHTYLQIPFSDDWGAIRKAVGRVDARQLLGDTGGTNIYQAIFLATKELFAGRTGRKAIVLLTDGQDSGLGLTLDPASSRPRPGLPNNQLTFEDVLRELSTQDVQVFAVSTESRPKIMTAAFLATSRRPDVARPNQRAMEKFPRIRCTWSRWCGDRAGNSIFCAKRRPSRTLFIKLPSKFGLNILSAFPPRWPAHSRPLAPAGTNCEWKLSGIRMRR